MTLRRLILGQVPEDFNPARDIAAGPWCFIGKETSFPGWENYDYVDPFDTPDKLIKAEADTSKLIDEVAADWGTKLNKIHGINRSVWFWHRYLCFWISILTMAGWSRWRLFEDLIKKYGDELITVEVTSDDETLSHHTFTSLFDHILYDAGHQIWLQSAIIRALAPKTWTLIEIPMPNVGTRDSELNAFREQQSPSRLQRLRQKAPRLPFDHLPGTRWSKIIFSAFICLLPKSPADRRNGLGGAANAQRLPDTFVTTLNNIIRRAVPESIGGELFKSLDAQAKARKYYPGRLLITNTRPTDELQRMICAHAIEAGERLVNAQHGGWEGTAAAVSWNRHNFAQDHAYLTWGWTRQAGMAGRFEPHLGPILNSIKRSKNAGKSKGIVMVGARPTLNGMRFDCIPRPPAMLHYRAAKAVFLNALPRDVLEDLWYRPYTRSAVDLEEREFIKTAAPSIRFVEGNLHKALSTCRLAVLDHLGTTIHFVLAGNVPFVGFWRPEDWALCEEAKPFFARLIDNGVLFECPKDAANQIAAINGNVEKWWQSEPVRSSVGACKYQYARTGPSSMLSMFKTLLSINRPLPEAHSETHTTAASKTAC